MFWGVRGWGKCGGDTVVGVGLGGWCKWCAIAAARPSVHPCVLPRFSWHGKHHHPSHRHPITTHAPRRKPSASLPCMHHPNHRHPTTLDIHPHPIPTHAPRRKHMG